MIEDALNKLVEKQNLTFDEARQVNEEIMSGNTTPVKMAAFLTTLRMKGETADEVAGMATVMREKMTKLNIKDNIIVDTCGTGGDKKHTFNISTLTAFVVAGAGYTVAKHGNKSVSSQCGSADILECLGVKIDLAPNLVEKCINEIGIGFMFAPLFHPAMKNVMPVRKELGIRTVFNILGPLCNPAGANVQLLGVYSPELSGLMAEVLNKLGTKNSMVVHGNGLDEISVTDDTEITEISDGKIKKYKFNPEKYGVKKSKLELIQTQNKDGNVALFLDVLNGKKSPARDAVLLNAGATIYLAAKAKQQADIRDIKDGISVAESVIDSGKALEKLNLLKKVS